ncbi:MAG: (2Fe-2S)-binding protein [Paracoccaceae bacterium]|jgi:aerobic-type carbon monoxide dehydrogenase small subunit (CoxS/CutS family)|nr:(2Fe-2S)-binding protein [Paracoccaceae bacterium]MDP5351329.1 (2Fe-2S)-binding protein [Paracoccaceae bacterium]MDP5354190.1 (2Fe-2S)-binding protein [Paracoccaceae bacterium]MDP5355718.1 (2Fe-2S)-binding protein [Paracoccaceae bacterium]MDP5358190.1 (2Fe-2S)-binding protein [Paracoccaceae bacterium]
MRMALRVNGQTHQIDCADDTPLLYILRNHLKLKGTKLGCGLEQCGACAVLVGGKVQLSCAALAADFVGQEIVTIEGVEALPLGQKVQAAFLDQTAAQCGYCTSGLVVAVTGLLSQDPQADQAKIKDGLKGHLCRCGSHPRVLRAVQQVVAQS